MSTESETLFTLKADFSFIHISTLPCVMLPPWQLSLAEHIKGATKSNTEGANTGFIMPERV